MSPHILAQRQKILLEAHVNNLIENLDMGSDYLNELLELAQQNISNQEFERLAMTKLMQPYH